MAHAKNTVFIDRPIADVFAYLANGENNSRWRGEILQVERTSDQDGLGATYRQLIGGPNGRRVRHDYRVTVYEPPTRLHFQHTVGLARPIGRFALTAAGPDRTAVEFELTWEAKGLKRVFNKMIESWMAAEVARLDQLKRLLEAQTGSAT
jgi:uncharacterized protein YndB with AHSA1/START domain